MEAFQKAGAKHLLPVDPKVPLVERPYMMRPGGTVDGKDLKQKGLTGAGQGAAQKRTKVDDKYEGLSKEGKLKSTSFSLPWSNENTAKIAAENAVAAKKLAAAKKGVPVKAATPAKTGFPGFFSAPAKPNPVPVKEEKKKGGFFGMF